MTPTLWLAALLVLLAWFVMKRIQSTRRIEAFRSRGAVVVDVRSPEAFRGGHAEGSTNLPLDELPGLLGRLDPSKPVLLCCASGARSSVAARLLKAEGFEVFNAGSWTRLQ